jgi:lipid II:glycine glycyltransferase (peptidoglycan interpeptide bridge formation enzyme)
MREGRPVAGICLARHGNAATYLLGWNGDEGRRYRANHYLLWEAIRRLPGSDTAWLDLGGLDEENTPGITSFKMGLNGERYELIGEYWKW